MNKALITSACLALLSGCGSSDPVFDVSIAPSNYPQQHVIRGSVLVDEIEIQKVTVNRGNCKAIVPVSLPRTLKFGQVLETYVTLCRAKEITYETSAGDETFTFE